MTTLTWTIARALARTWRAGDEIVLSRLDHDANIRPWLQLAEERGVEVRWAEVDIETGELPAWQYDELLTRRTRLVALTAASNAIGTCPDVAGITARAHEVGALTFVDAVHAAPHVFLDLRELGADFLALSACKWCGPHVGGDLGAPAAARPAAAGQLVPAPDRVPDRFECGRIRRRAVRRDPGRRRPPGGSLRDAATAPGGTGSGARWPWWRTTRGSCSAG